MARIYNIKEAYYTLQGEGAQTGRAAVFLRFAGCNLWTGLERDRAKAICTFCDTDFVGMDGPGGGKFSALDLAKHIRNIWDDEVHDGGIPYVVCTGGEPLLQLDDALVKALKDEGLEIGIETNGTLSPPDGIDWICVSPKADTSLLLTFGNECKLVYPQKLAPPERFASLDFDHFFLQPMDGPQREENTLAVVKYCRANPQWRISLQTHKLLGID